MTHWQYDARTLNNRLPRRYGDDPLVDNQPPPEEMAAPQVRG